MEKINFIAPINKLSYGYCGYFILKELMKSNIDVAYFPISPHIEVDNPQDTQWIGEFYNRSQLSGGYKDSPAIRLWHQFQLDMFPHCTERIGWPIFELDTFSQREKNHLNNCDKIICCSKWGKEIILNQIDKKSDEVIVAPLGVDLDIFNYNPTRLYDNKCIFLVCGKREIRKISDLIPSIFEKAFEQIDNVELWMAWTNIFESPEENTKWENFYKNSKLGNKIRFIPRLNTLLDVAQIYNQIDCLWSCSRAEGFMLPALEAMACGLNIIACNYSGVTEFLNHDNSYLIDIDNYEVAYDGKFFDGSSEGKWARFEENQIDQCIEYLRKVYKDKQEQNKLFNQIGQNKAQDFTWANTTQQILEVLK